MEGAGDPAIESYVRFTVTGLQGSVTRATLRLHATTDTVDGPRVAGTTNDWGEKTLTWDNRPLPTTGFVDDEGDLFHVAVYIADDLVYTKNGTSPMAPWTIVTLDYLRGYYKGRATDLRLIYHRRNDF